MKNLFTVSLILTIGTLGSCDKPTRVFQVDSDVQHKTLKLYEDSSFIEEVTEIEDSYHYSGTWSGDLKEGESFTTISTQKGNRILAKTHVHRYLIINGEAVEKKDPTTLERSNMQATKYSKKFINHFRESNVTLKGDSIVFPTEADSVIVLIPKYLPKNQNVLFETDAGNSITIRQINYTDIEFSINYDNQDFDGKASLSPFFHLGTETVEFSDGEYTITHYNVTESDNPCLDFIGLGNQNIAEENPEKVYALVSVAGETCEEELRGLTNKKLETVVSK